MEEDLRWARKAINFFIQILERETEAEQEDAETDNPAVEMETEVEKEDAETDNEAASSDDVMVISLPVPHNKTHRTRGALRHKHSKQLDSLRFSNNLKNIWSSLSPTKKSTFSYIESFVFQKYMDSKCRNRGLDWVKKKNVFASHYVVLPIIIWGHWVVTIFCNFGGRYNSAVNSPCILFLDSMTMAEYGSKLEPNIKGFVIDIYKLCGITEEPQVLRKIPFLVPNVPQQRDGHSCGYFALYFIKLFIENAPQRFNLSGGYPYFMNEDWFTTQELDSFRRTLT